jgi:hypothetical protein
MKKGFLLVGVQRWLADGNPQLSRQGYFGNVVAFEVKGLV